MESTFYPEDIVARKDDPTRLAVVQRTHDDVDTHGPSPARLEARPIKRDVTISEVVLTKFLANGIPPKGVLAVRWREEGDLELVPSSLMFAIDRQLLVGDIVKRPGDVMSGVVINTETRCTLQPICDITYQGSKCLKGLLPYGDRTGTEDGQFRIDPDGRPGLIIDVPASELKYCDSPSIGDLVVYKDWMGRIEAITNMISLRLTDNCVVEINEPAAQHNSGVFGSFCVGDIVKTKKGILRTGNWIYGRYNPNTHPVGTIVSIRTIAIEVFWVQNRIKSADRDTPPEILESPELGSPHFQVYDRTRKPPTSVDSEQLQSTVSNSEIDLNLNLRVRFRDLPAAFEKYGKSSNSNKMPLHERKDNLGYDLNVFDVASFHATVTVHWQDLSMTRDRSIDLVPDSSIDDRHAAWPSEITHSLARKPVPTLPNVESPERVGVIQSVHEAERMARVRWYANSCIQYIKVDDIPNTLLHYCMDRSEAVEEDVSLYDIETPEQLNVRRGDITMITSSELNVPADPPNNQTWIGEIVDTLLDGRLVVRLGAAATVQDVILPREQCMIAVRSDGGGMFDWDDEDMIDVEVSEEESDEMDAEWDSQREDSSQSDLSGVKLEDENGDPMARSDVEDEDWETDDEDDADNDGRQVDTDMPDAHDALPTPPIPLTTSPVGEHVETTDRPLQTGEPLPVPPEAYMVLDGETPESHHYCNEPSSPQPTHMKRTQKEHKILRTPNALPDGVFIRTWESRLDLLRVLLIGPSETPYSDSPFVVDFYLPSTFPTQPPRAFFHSWPVEVSLGATGRVNPNLYEDGTICLSILGTWEGSSGEGWNPTRSTLLQVIVSLLGLVLVREPYFNEAGYEPLVGTDASKRPSALYSERTFLRSKGFTVTALSKRPSGETDEQPRSLGLEGLEDVIQWLYYAQNGPALLRAQITDVEAILKRSEEGEGVPNGLTVMSKGACISLRRILDRLRQLAS